MHKEAREELRVRLKLVVLELADHFEKILAMRTEYQLGALRIMYYMDRCHGLRFQNPG